MTECATWPEVAKMAIGCFSMIVTVLGGMYLVVKY